MLLPVDFVQLTESGVSAGNFIRISAEMRKCRFSRLFAIDIALTELLEYFSLPKLQIMQKCKSAICKNQLFTIDTVETWQENSPALQLRLDSHRQL